MKKYVLSDIDVIEASRTSSTGAEAARKLGVNYKVYRRISSELGCFKKNPRWMGERIKKRLLRLDAIVLDGREQKEICPSILMDYLLAKKLKKSYKCEICGVSEWNNKPITLQIHHIDGNHFNNVISNLQILCPNCHSQTDTYCSKNRMRYKKSKLKVKSENKYNYGKSYVCENCGNEVYLRSRQKIVDHPMCKSCRHMKIAAEKRNGIEMPLRDVLEKEVFSMSFIRLAKKYHVSNTTIKRWCKKLGIKLEKRTTRQFG